jgi:putative tributyrin esterase
MYTPCSVIVRRLIIASLLCIVCSGCTHSARQADTVEQVSKDDEATVTDVHFRSSSIDGMFWYRTIVPKVGSNERLPVLYLLHGIDSDPREVMEHSSVLKLATASRLIIMMPAVGYSYYTNAKHKRNARWEDGVAQELPRDVENRFPVLSGREHTGIAGISMGGYGAVKLALKHPELYGFAGNMSGSLNITRRQASLRRWGQTLRIWNTFGVRPNIRRDEDVFDLLEGAKEVKNETWFESCGKDDPLLGVNEQFAHKLRVRRAKPQSIITSGGHDWRSWNTAMPDLFSSAEKALR